ncbi:hypothetical protein BBJ28_00015836 [Nothophytophthora sp. Chile5]|nr:hypothetical protein BBJ28_00015836 [Nothophytophthora sp. Chile5]
MADQERDWDRAAFLKEVQQLDESDSRAPAPAAEEWPLACGDSLELSGLSGLNVSAFILQYARMHRGGSGLHDGATGEFATYPQLVGFVETVAVGLQAHEFQAGDMLSISESSSDLRTLVLILSVWRLRGVVAICESGCGDQDTFSKEQSKESVWVATGKQPKKVADCPTGQQSRTILTGPWDADTDGLLRYEELMTAQPQRQTLFGQVRSS